jgi:hypothetical protein
VQVRVRQWFAVLVVACVSLFLSVHVLAQAVDACQASVSPFTVTSGAPFTVAWVMDPLGPVSATDPTLVPQRIDGYSLQIDSGPKQDLIVAALAAVAPCPVGTPMAGKIPYQVRTASGVGKGNHTASLSAWNFVLDSAGNPTTTRQEGSAVSIPFVGVDPVQAGPPNRPLNLGIKR